MQLFFMRHGDAINDLVNDVERPLSNLGQHQVQDMAHWLSNQLDEFDLVLVSPYLRTNQTWLEMAEFFRKPKKLVVLNDLIPSGKANMTVDVILAYAEQYEAKNVLIISHMPILGYLIAELVPDCEPPLFAPSAVCLVERYEGKCNKVYLQTPDKVMPEMVS